MKSSNLFLTLVLIFQTIFSSGQSILHASLSELFIETPAGARYTVTIDDETISSRSGRFRFFDLSAGRLPIEIALENRLILKSDVFAKPGMRSILILNKKSLRTIKDLDLSQVNLDSWDRIHNDDYGSPRPNRRRTYQHEDYPREMSPQGFSNFLNSLRKTPFYKDKLSLIDVTVGYSYFSTSQIKNVMNLMHFSDEKFEILEKMSPFIADSENIYELIESFRFSDDKERARAIILAGRNQRGRR